MYSESLVRMFIVCTNCRTKYRTENTEIEANGRLVRCTRCQHEWVAYPDDYEKIEREAKLGKNEAKETEDAAPIFGFFDKTMPFILSVLFSLILLVASAVLLSITYYETLYHTSMHKVYKMLKVHNSTGLSIAGLEVNAEETKPGFMQAAVIMDIYNRNDFISVADKMRISIYDKDGELVDDMVMNIKKVLEPHAVKEVPGTLSKLPFGSKYIVLDIGNTIDMMNISVDRLLMQSAGINSDASEQMDEDNQKEDAMEGV